MTHVGHRQGVVLAAKSPWLPPIRREHALAQAAAASGHPVVFVERQADIRELWSGARGAWFRAIVGRQRASDVQPDCRVLETACFLPGHRSDVAERSAAILLHRDLRRVVERTRPAAVVAATPWQWSAVRRLRGVRRVLEVTDDWGELIPARKRRMHDLYSQASFEADAIILVTEGLRHLFPTDSAEVIPNGVSRDLLETPLEKAPGERRMVYVGTLSPRFDHALTSEVLTLLPDWHLDLYGPCQYPGRGGEPDVDLRRLLTRSRRQIRWHGVVPRERVASVIDAADVAVIPNDARLMTGQDSMKLYDYAARGRPIVATGGRLASDDEAGVTRAQTAREFADGVVAALTEATSVRDRRRLWAEDQSWDTRWPSWWAAVTGQDGTL